MKSKAKPMGFMFPTAKGQGPCLVVRANHDNQQISLGSDKWIWVQNIPDFCAALQELADEMTRTKEESEDDNQDS